MMAKRKFEIGDRVRVKTQYYGGAHDHQEGEVVAYANRLYRVSLSVLWRPWFYARELELVERAKERERKGVR